MTDDSNRDFSGAVNQSPGMNEREGVAERAINEIVQRVSEWDDRTSPEDWPEAMLITAEELRDELRGLASVLAPAPSAWQPIETEPNDGAFRFYGLHVNHESGSRWFEAHYLAWNDEGNMMLPSGDNFDDWAHSDFEYWAPAPSLPSSDRGGVG